ncbi:MAG: hypothetical protein ACQEXJ_01785 [Myxococcota bacterium]
MSTEANNEIGTDERTRRAPRRRPYEPPRIRSGPAFETVELQSCSPDSLSGCDNPC